VKNLSILDSLAKFALSRIGPNTWLFKIFGDPTEDIKKAWINLTADEYSSLMFLISIIASALSADILALLFVFIRIPWYIVPTAFVLVFFLSNATFRVYPIFLKSEISSSLSLRLPYLVMEMAALSDTGMTIEKIFESMLALEPDKYTRKVLSFIVRNIKIFGMDITQSLDATIKRSPSRDFAEFILSLKGALMTGSEVRHFLAEYSQKVMIDKKINLRYLIERLNIIAETFTTLFVVLPSVLLIMILLFTMISFKPYYYVFFLIITYGLIPLMGIFFIMLLEATRPR